MSQYTTQQDTMKRSCDWLPLFLSVLYVCHNGMFDVKK